MGGDALHSVDGAALEAASVSQALMGLMLVIGLIIVLAYVIKRLRAFRLQSVGVDFSVLMTLPLGTKERIVLIQLADKQYLLGVGSGSIQLLETLSGDERIQIQRAQKPVSGVFAEKLVRYMQQAREGSR